MLRWLCPHLRLGGVLELTVERLREIGLDALLLDVDCTLKPYHERDISPEVSAWLSELREAGIGLCLVSNGRGRRIREFAQRLGLPYVAKALKPLPFGVRKAIRQRGFERRRTAMVGDQVFADVMAGRLAGVTSIYVRPMHPEQEPWFTRLKRPFERLVLRGMADTVQPTTDGPFAESPPSELE